MIKYYILLYLDIFIKGFIFLLFGMKTWSIYTCNKDYFEKKYNHVKNFGDVFKDEWPQIDKLSVCDDDTNLDGLGFIKRGFIFSINWSDYCTKRWICFFLNFGLEPFCCDDPKQNCQGDTEFITKELPDALPKHSDTILLGIISFFKIIGYGGLNLLYLLILFPVSLTAGYSGSWESKEDFSSLCNEVLKKAIEDFPKLPWGTQWMGALFKWGTGTFGPLGIWMAKWGFFFASWAMLCAFNYVRILFFMLSGEECGCNLFAKWEKQSNKLILTRMAIPILLWASLIFSLFMFFQISMLRGITSPQIMHPDYFKECLYYYFMKYDITILKKKNMKPDKINYFYAADQSFEKNIDDLTSGDFMTNDDESYYLNRLPQILAALQIDLKNLGNPLQKLNDTFKNNQMVLSDALNHIYGEGLDTVYDKLKKLRHINGKEEKEYKWMSQHPFEYGKGKTSPSNYTNYITPEIIDKIYEYKILKNNRPKESQGDNDDPKITKWKTDKYNKGREIKTLIDKRDKTYTDNIKLYSTNSNPQYTSPKKPGNDGSIGGLFAKIYEIFALFANMPFKFIDRILQSNLMELPFKMIDVLLSDKILNLVFLIPEKLIELPIFLLELPIFFVKLPIWFLKLFAGIIS